MIDKIKDEIEYYTETVENYPELASTQKDLIDIIDKYYQSKFRDGCLDSLGQRKAFYNINKLQVDVASKMSDLDVKNILLLGEDWASEYYSWIMSKQLRIWLKERYFGRQLNLYSHIRPKYGDLWVKKVGSDVIIVPIQNLIFRPLADKLEDTPIIECHYYGVAQFYSEAKKRGWENYEDVEKYKNGRYYSNRKTNEVKIYEVYFPDGFLDEKDNWFLVSIDAKKILASSKIDCPYKKLSWEKLPNRLQGIGRVEESLEDQVYLNRIANYKAEGLHWTSKKLFQTRDNKIGSNLLTDLDNGDILKVNAEVVPIQTEERNLSFYNYEEGRWESNAMRKAFANEAVTGEQAPINTPFRSTLLNAQMTGAYYKQKREELGMFVEEIITDWVLPDFEKEMKREHKILIKHLLEDEDNSENFFNMLVDNELNRKKWEGIMNGKLIMGDEERFMRSVVSERMKKEKYTFPEGFYKDLKYKVRVEVAGESIDAEAKNGLSQLLIQLLSTNPNVFYDKMGRKVLSNTIKNVYGMNSNDILPPNVIEDLETTLAKSRGLEKGGSISVPNNTNPVMAQTAV
jgi:hypothetical protein